MKIIYKLFNAPFYALRPFFMFNKKPTTREILNVIIILTSDLAIVKFLGF